MTLVLLIIWRVYWSLTTKNAAIKKPKTSNYKRIVEIILFVLAGGYIIASLMGFVIFPFNSLLFQVIGFILVIIGFAEAMVARKTLDSNWTESYEYQIKKNHELVTKGIYKYVRHPIYGGILMLPTGALIVSGSYTFIIGFLISLTASQIFARREEKILIKHFGKKYLEYKKTTKKFIPFIY
jgi:protein-S-isoprenylcysteine O-methyltransferase Ste14